jgi:histidinol dehydrogenase
MRRLVGFEVETLPGVHLGQKIIPVASSGSYVPGGRHPMLASAHMTVITPKVAGVERVVACSPPAKGQGPWPATVYSMAAAGADEIYCNGSVFLGEETTVAYGDKTIGTNHVLPTMKAARCTGGLSVGKFVKTVTYQYATREASLKIAEVCERVCNCENMLAHGISCKVRVDKYRDAK